MSHNQKVYVVALGHGDYYAIVGVYELLSDAEVAVKMLSWEHRPRATIKEFLLGESPDVEFCEERDICEPGTPDEVYPH